MTELVVTDLIPQRPPFLFVDDIVEWAGERLQARWTPDPAAPFFTGHFPGNPVLPGVLISEACFQAGGALMALRTAPAEREGRVPVLTRIQDARFKRIVRPGETLWLDLTLDDVLGEASYLTARAQVGDELAARIAFAVMLAAPIREAGAS